MKCNLKRHQETQICKNKALLTTMSDEETHTKKTNKMNVAKDIMKQTKKK